VLDSNWNKLISFFPTLNKKQTLERTVKFISMKWVDNFSDSCVCMRVHMFTFIVVESIWTYVIETQWKWINISTKLSPAKWIQTVDIGRPYLCSQPGADVKITILFDFCQFSAKKIGVFFSKTNVMIIEKNKQYMF
jgi:hypothetical protein